ncbi:hypothetical protein GWK47_054018 [Chionoecetes opilio]|uniref:Uncharacterized protein n=1 Tax=Chionoecetes opilio TaxID=41210 RepID=A0A8J4Y0I7_CHIOP|nr:hypothetical protein GWK47_054018 [Chionoecetes opilio]
MSTSVEQHHLFRVLAGDATTTCRVLIFHLDASSTFNITMIMRKLEHAELWKQPQTRIVVLGGRKGGKQILLAHSFRNIVHGLYLIVHQRRQANTTHHGRQLKPRQTHETTQKGWSRGVSLYRRCLYCKEGNEGVEHIGRWQPSRASLDTYFLDKGEHMRSFNGHKFKIVSVGYIPYVDYTRNKEEPGTTITLTNCLDAYNLSTLSKTLNFT